MTVQDILYQAMRHSGIVKFAGRTPSPEELADAKREMNSMLDAWNTEKLTIPEQIKRLVFTLTPSKASYTLGPDGDWPAQRPARIERAGLILLTNPSSPYEVPLRGPVNAEEWADVRLKSLESTQPQVLFDDRAFALANLYFWPIPTFAHQVALYVWSQLSAYSDLTDAVNLPPGYGDAIIYNLAVRLSSFWSNGNNGAPSPLVIEQARESKAAIKRLNIRPLLMRCDSGALGERHGYGYDIQTGDYRR